MKRPVAALLLAIFNVMVTMCFVGNCQALGQPGALDPSFEEGFRVINNGDLDDYFNKVLIQPDGKIVAVGQADTGASFGSAHDFVVCRFLQNGLYDPSFNDGSTVVTGLGTHRNDYAKAAALQTDGKIVVVGSSEETNTNPNNIEIALARYKSDGSLDATFGTGGKVITSLGAGDEFANDVTIQGDGGIVLVGTKITNGKHDFAVLRYTPSGALDSTFNGAGQGVYTIGAGADDAAAVQVDTAGRILIAGTTFNGVDSDIAVIRLNQNGTLDTSFNGTGKFVAALGNGADSATEIAIQADGKIVVGGTTQGVNGGSVAIMRLNPNGEFDLSFGTGGKVVMAIPPADNTVGGMCIQPDGKIVIAGGVYSGRLYGYGFRGSDILLLRLGANGAFDETFNEGAPVKMSNADVAYATSVALQQDGKLVAVGYTRSGNYNDAFVARYLGVLEPPIVSNVGTSMVTKVTASLAGAVNANGGVGSAFFEYGLSAQYGSATASQSISGTTSINLNAPLSGLEANTVYHFRMVATNLGGTSLGSDQSFTTLPDPPAVATGNAAGIGGNTATLVGGVNPNGRLTKVYFEYGLTSQYGSTTPEQQLAPSQNVQDVLASIGGLIAGATYHFRTVANNVATPVPVYGDDVTFVTNGSGGGVGATAKPSVVTSNETGLTSRGAVFNGMVNPNGGTTLAFFEYGLTVSYGMQTVPQGVGSGADPVNVSKVLGDLQPASTYHYRLVASNSLGTTRGDDVMFQTPFDAPSVVTLTPAVGTTFATFKGTINPNGVSTTAVFEYGTTPALGATTSIAETLGGSEAKSVSLRVTGLNPETLYYFKLSASSSAGATSGAIGTFTTLGAQPPVAVDDVLFTGGGNVSVDVLANDVNADTGESSVGLSFDGIARPGSYGQIAGGPVVNYDPDSVFPLQGDSFDYRVKSVSGLTDTGTVTVLPFGAFVGTYGGSITGGAVYDGGLVTIELGARGTFSGQLRWQNERYALKDAFGASGERVIAKHKVGAESGVDLILRLKLDRSGVILAELIDESSDIALPFSLYRASASSLASVGIYTATHGQLASGVSDRFETRTGILGPKSVPGIGYTIGVVSKRATSGRLVGRLGDSEPYSGGSKFFADRLALNASLYGKTSGRRRTFGGSLTGDTQFNGDGTLTSVLEWVKQAGSSGLYPDGFRNGLQVTGERFSSPGFGENPFVTILTLLGAQRARVELRDGDLGNVRLAEVQFSLVPGGLKGRVLAGAGVPKMTFSVNRQGQFSGRFVHPTTNATTRYFGAFRKSTGVGQGNFRGSSSAGSVRVFKAN